jgi:hypothetical protein
MAYVLQTNIADAGKPEAWRTAEYFTTEAHALAVLAQMPDPTVWRVVRQEPKTATALMISWRNDYY